MEDLVRYLDEIVDPTVAEFEAAPTSRRKAFLTCVAIFHAVDYLSHPRKPGNLRKNWRNQSHDFAQIDDVAHAFKHVRSDGRNPLNASKVISRPPAACGTLAAGLSRIGDAVGGVTLEDAPEVDILDAIRGAVAFLRQQAAAPRK
jgi:hypothetical protein